MHLRLFLRISDQAAFNLTKELSDLSKNPSPEALQTLTIELGDMIKSSKNASPELVALYNKVADLSTIASQAAYNLESMKTATDNLTAGQKNLIKQSERTLALSKLQGDARARLQAQYAAEDVGFAKDDPHAKQMEDDAVATYKNTQAQKTLQSENKKGASRADSIAQKLANLKQQSELAADSTNKLSREQAILNAQQSLGKGAMQGGGSGGASIQQEIHFHIETTGGIDDATMAKMSQMMKQVTLFHISDQANRPGGLIQPRTKK